MKERAYLTIYRRWMKKEKQKKNRPDESMKLFL